MPLQKYYFDVVSAEGAYGTAYFGTLRALGFTLAFSELSSSVIQNSSTFLSISMKRRKIINDDFQFLDSARRLEARWRGGCTFPSGLAYQNKVLRWELVQLRSLATILHHANPLLFGLGYGERVTLFASPFDLGIRNLFWGRYLSENAFMMWIVAEGIQPIQYGILDMSEYSQVSLTNDKVEIGGAKLVLGPEVRTIFDGDALQDKTVLSALAILVYGRKPVLRQHKAVYNCEVQLASGRREHGFVIAETVRF